MINYQHTRLAQLVERKALNLVVEGSSPSVGVKFFLIFMAQINISSLGKELTILLMISIITFNAIEAFLITNIIF